MKITITAFIALAIVSGLFGATSAHAQSVTVEQAVGAGNAMQLQQTFGVLSVTLGQLSTRLSAGTLSDSDRVNARASLFAISGSLAAIGGTVAALASRASTVAQAQTNTNVPGLPNTGGGGAAGMK